MTQYEARPAGDRTGLLASILAGVFALIVGGVVGFVTTFTHAQYAPWGLVIGLVVVAALLVGFRLVFESRRIAGAAGLGVLAAASVLSLPADAGIVLSFTGVTAVVDVVWAAGCTLIGLAVAVWPNRVRASE